MAMDKQKQKEQQEEKQKQSRNALGRFTGLAFQMVAAVVGGVFLGRWLDVKFDTTHSHVFLVIFTFVGVIAGMYATIREVLKK
jgi:ATP synthase protein I